MYCTIVILCLECFHCYVIIIDCLWTSFDILYFSTDGCINKSLTYLDICLTKNSSGSHCFVAEVLKWLCYKTRLRFAIEQLRLWLCSVDLYTMRTSGAESGSTSSAWLAGNQRTAPVQSTLFQTTGRCSICSSSSSLLFGMHHVSA